MSRIGKIPIKLPKGVKVTITDANVKVAGPKGNLSTDYNSYVQIKQEGDGVVVSRLADDKKSRAFHGLYQRMLVSMVAGVTEGFSKELEIVGIGYRAAIEGKNLVLNLGYSHPVNMAPPEGISFEVPAPNKIIVRGYDKQKVGQVAANIRKVRPPEPYKGKGVRYVDEYVKRKVGKTGGK